MVLNLAVLHDDTALETDTVANDNVGSNDHVGTNAAVVTDLGGGVDHDIAAVHVRLGDGDQLLGVAFGQGAEVQASTSEEILGLADIHPEALQVK